MALLPIPSTATCPPEYPSQTAATLRSDPNATPAPNQGPPPKTRSNIHTSFSSADASSYTHSCISTAAANRNTDGTSCKPHIRTNTNTSHTSSIPRNSDTTATNNRSIYRISSKATVITTPSTTGKFTFSRRSTGAAHTRPPRRRRASSRCGRTAGPNRRN